MNLSTHYRPHTSHAQAKPALKRAPQTKLTFGTNESQHPEQLQSTGQRAKSGLLDELRIHWKALSTMKHPDVIRLRRGFDRISKENIKERSELLKTYANPPSPQVRKEVDTRTQWLEIDELRKKFDGIPRANKIWRYDCLMDSAHPFEHKLVTAYVLHLVMNMRLDEPKKIVRAALPHLTEWDEENEPGEKVSDLAVKLIKDVLRRNLVTDGTIVSALTKMLAHRPHEEIVESPLPPINPSFNSGGYHWPLSEYATDFEVRKFGNEAEYDKAKTTVEKWLNETD